MSDRDHRQRIVHDWAVKTFGMPPPNAEITWRQERVRRLLEEAIELAQAEGITFLGVSRLADHVFSKPRGEPVAEAGAVGLTLLAYCEAAGISADGAEMNELDRVLAMPAAEHRVRRDAKIAAGVAAGGGG